MSLPPPREADSVVLEHDGGDRRYRYDVVLLRSSIPVFVVEIRLSHPVSDPKLDAIPFPWIEIDGRELLNGDELRTREPLVLEALAGRALTSWSSTPMCPDCSALEARERKEAAENASREALLRERHHDHACRIVRWRLRLPLPKPLAFSLRQTPCPKCRRPLQLPVPTDCYTWVGGPRDGWPIVLERNHAPALFIALVGDRHVEHRPTPPGAVKWMYIALDEPLVENDACLDVVATNVALGRATCAWCAAEKRRAVERAAQARLEREAEEKQQALHLLNARAEVVRALHSAISAIDRATSDASVTGALDAYSKALRDVLDTMHADGPMGEHRPEFEDLVGEQDEVLAKRTQRRLVEIAEANERARIASERAQEQYRAEAPQRLEAQILGDISPIMKRIETASERLELLALMRQADEAIARRLASAETVSDASFGLLRSMAAAIRDRVREFASARARTCNIDLDRDDPVTVLVRAWRAYLVALGTASEDSAAQEVLRSATRVSNVPKWLCPAVALLRTSPIEFTPLERRARARAIGSGPP